MYTRRIVFIRMIHGRIHIACFIEGPTAADDEKASVCVLAKRTQSAGDGNGALFWGENFCARKQTRYGSYNSRKKLKPSRVYAMSRGRAAAGKMRATRYADRLFYCAARDDSETKTGDRIAYDANGFFFRSDPVRVRSTITAVIDRDSDERVYP